jgi:hypothetical protein
MNKMTGDIMSNDKCKKCGSSDTYWTEKHPDTGMDEFVLVCRLCKPKPKKMRFRFIMKEKISIKWHGIYGKYVVRKLFKLARKSTRYTFGYCSWCGRQPGFASSISRKGLRCTDCIKY